MFLLGAGLSSRGRVNLTINNLLSIYMKTKHCLHGTVCCEGVWRSMFSWLCSPVFLACYCGIQAITVSICWPQLCCPRFVHSDLLVEQLRRAAWSLWTSHFAHLSHFFHFHWIQELLEDWVHWKTWKNFQFSRTFFSRQIVGVVTFKNFGGLEKAMCTDLIDLRLNLSNHFQSLGNAAAMAILKFFQNISFLRWAGIQTLHVFSETVMFWGYFASLSLPGFL